MRSAMSIVKALAEEHGSPLYVFDEDSFVKNYRSFEACMRSVYENYQISYSYKTNYSPYICRLVRKLRSFPIWNSPLRGLWEMTI